MAMPSPLGALMFSVGLLTCLSNAYALFTGMVKDIPYRWNPQFLLALVQALFLNIIGCAIIAGIGNLAFDDISNKAYIIMEAVASAGWITVFMRAILCGLLITFACYAYQCNEWYLTILCVFIFVFCGMRHCIADAFYLTAAGMWSVGFLNWTASIVGNVVGGILPALVVKMLKFQTSG